MLLLKNMIQKHELDQLEIGSNVAIYDPGKTSYKHWHKIGRILEVLPKKQQGFPNGGVGWGRNPKFCWGNSFNWVART